MKIGLLSNSLKTLRADDSVLRWSAWRLRDANIQKIKRPSNPNAFYPSVIRKTLASVNFATGTYSILMNIWG